MYRVLIVDDEEPAREIFKYLIDWGKTSFTISGFAKNGMEALEQYAVLQPDLVVTDIQMPIMDGLELIRRVRSENKGQKFVILSCHENFKYAKEAIRLGVSDYLLKDLLTSQDLYSLLEKVRSEIETENALRMNNRIFRLYTGETLYKEEIKNVALKSISFDNLPDHSIHLYISEFNLDFSSRYHMVLCVVIDDYAKFIDKTGRSLEKQKIFEIIKSIRDTLEEFNGGECFYDDKGTFVAIAGIKDTNSELYYISTCHTIAGKIHSNVMKVHHATVTVGISNSFSSLKEIKAKYDDAMKLVKYRVFLGKGKTILYNVQSVKTASVNTETLDHILNEIRSHLGKGEIENAKSLVKSIYNDEIKGFVQYNYLKYVNSQMLGMILEFCRKNNISCQRAFECEYPPLEKVEEFETVQEMSDWFCAVIEGINNTNAAASHTVYSRHVKDATRYIKENYCCRLGLSQISEELGVNKAYLCRIFKQETGENLTDYVSKVRIEKAKELIISTNEKLYEIAEKVGFINIQHFNNSFKKITGQSPLKFRNTGSIIG